MRIDEVSEEEDEKYGWEYRPTPVPDFNKQRLWCAREEEHDDDVDNDAVPLEDGRDSEVVDISAIINKVGGGRLPCPRVTARTPGKEGSRERTMIG